MGIEEKVARALASHASGGVVEPDAPDLAWRDWLTEAHVAVRVIEDDWHDVSGGGDQMTHLCPGCAIPDNDSHDHQPWCEYGPCPDCGLIACECDARYERGAGK